MGMIKRINVAIENVRRNKFYWTPHCVDTQPCATLEVRMSMKTIHAQRNSVEDLI
jgi:hypothetical protein